jgi:hypothetical protein
MNRDSSDSVGVKTDDAAETAGLPALAAAEAGSSQPLALADSFEPVLLRCRHDGWTPARQRAFVEELANCLCVETAAERVGMSPQSAYELRRRAGAEGFAAAWDAALCRGITERGRARLVDEAVNGRVVKRFYHGELIAEERVYSERLLLKLVEKGDRLFAGAEQSKAIAADWEDSMARLESGALAGGYRVWQDKRADWWTNYPPPPDFDNYLGEPTDLNFQRPLTEAEEEAIEAQQEERIEAGEAARDAFFGFSPRRRAIDRRSRSKP